MSLETIADELYGLLPQDFTSTRNDLARLARGAGDRALADDIRALRKPTAVAWLANQVVRQHGEMVESLLALGQELREAMAAPSGPELHRLNARQRELVHALVLQAAELATTSGQPATEQVLQGLTDTLRAAMADPRAAEALASGRLSAALPPAAFAGLPQAGDTAAMVAEPAPPAAPAAAPEGEAELVARRERARQLASEAQVRADAARHAFEQARASLEDARAASRLAAELVEHLSGQLAEAQAQHDSAQQAEDASRHAHDLAYQATLEAEGRLLETLRELGHPLE